MFVPLYATFLDEGGFALFDIPGACSPANWTEQERLGVLHDFYAEHEQHVPLLGTKPHWMPVRMQQFGVVSSRSFAAHCSCLSMVATTEMPSCCGSIH